MLSADPRINARASRQPQLSAEEFPRFRSFGHGRDAGFRPGKALENGTGSVLGAVVHRDQLEILERLPENALDRLSEVGPRRCTPASRR